MDILTLFVDALLLAILAWLMFALLRIVHRHELALARQRDHARLGRPLPIRIDTHLQHRQRQILHRARHGGHSPGA